MKNNKVLPALLALGLTTGAAISPVFAEESNDNSEEIISEKKGLYTTKKSTLENDGTYTIDIEAWGTGKTTGTSIPERVPLDIVLVLDRSGSMNDKQGEDSRTTKLSALQSAVDKFVDNVSTDARTKNVTHRIAVSTFGNSDYTGYYYPVKSLGIFNPYVFQKYSDKASYNNAFFSISAENDQSTDLKKAVDNMRADGATPTDDGMTVAKNIWNKTGDRVEDGKTAKRVTIVFTDGSPTTHSSFSTKVANNALAAGNRIKKSPIKSEIYTIGVFDSDNLKNSKVQSFMTKLSSEYQNATSMDENNGQAIPENEGKYYFKTADASKLDSIFELIGSSVFEPSTSVELTSASVLKDIMSTGFNLPENLNGKVSVYEALGTQKDENSPIQWGNPIPSNLIAEPVEENGKVVGIQITGFDYSNEYVAPGKEGKKLILQIKGITPNDAAVSNAGTFTNSDGSGIYVDKDAKTPEIEFAKPSTILTEKAYVVDYAKTLKIDNSDWKMNTGFNAFGDFSKSPLGDKNLFGSFDFGSLNYVPKTTNWNDVDSAYLFGQTNDSSIRKRTANKNGNLWSRVSVLPANNVYYEDSFVTDNNNGVVGIEFTNDWNANSTGTDNYVTDETHGKWESSETADSDNTYTEATATDNTVPTAKFKFTGTGVDIYSRTNMNSGTISVVVASEEKKANGRPVFSKTYIIDTKSASSGDGHYYNIPTFSSQGLNYGTYDVTLKVTTAAVSDGGRATYAMSGVRVYNPLGDGSLASDYDNAYAGEYNAVFTSVKDHVNTGTGSNVFIDEVIDENGNSNPAVGSYDHALSPANEVYLNKYQSIAINTPKARSTNSLPNYYIGLKSPDGKPVTVHLTKDNTVVQEITVSSTVDQYYPVKTDGVIVVENVSEDENNLLSITKVRTAFAEAPAEAENRTVSIETLDETEAMNAVMAFRAMPVTGETETPKLEEEFENDPVENDVTDIEDDSTDLGDADIVIDNVDNEEVESDNSKTNWWNKLFGGLSGLFH